MPGDGKVVYLSLGSLGCMDVGLMQRLIDAMAKTEHRTIVSMGPLKDQMTLGPEHVRRSVPAAAVDPAAVRPAHHPRREQHGVRRLPLRTPDDRVAPLLETDDNAQRLRETGFGERLDHLYGWTDDELIGAVNRLLADEDLRARMPVRTPQAIRADPGRIKGADLLESVDGRGLSPRPTSGCPLLSAVGRT